MCPQTEAAPRRLACYVADPALRHLGRKPPGGHYGFTDLGARLLLTRLEAVYSWNVRNGHANKVFSAKHHRSGFTRMPDHGKRLQNVLSCVIR